MGYGSDMLGLLDEPTLERLGREGTGMPVDLPRAASEPAYALEILEAAPLGFIHAVESAAGRELDWAMLAAEAGEAGEPAQPDTPDIPAEPEPDGQSDGPDEDTDEVPDEDADEDSEPSE